MEAKEEESKKPQYNRLRVPPHPLEVWQGIYRAAIEAGKANFAAEWSDEGMRYYIEVRDKFLKGKK